MLLVGSLSVEVSQSSDRHIVRFCCSAGEDDFFRVGADDLSYVFSSCLHCILALPTVMVRPESGQVYLE